jgi:hypothetical protein
VLHQLENFIKKGELKHEHESIFFQNLQQKGILQEDDFPKIFSSFFIVPKKLHQQ